MKRYANIQHGAVQSVEISLTPEALQACIYVHDTPSLKLVEAKIAQMGYTVLSQTTVDKSPMLIVTGPRDEAAFIQGLTPLGGKLAAQQEKKPFDAWKVRSYLGFGGQILQLASSVTKHKVDAPLLIFATTNLTANGINLAYKAQKRGDPHQLRMLKNTINERLAPQLTEGMHAIHVDDQRALLREQNRPKPVDKIDAFMRKNSVNVGELGLRYFGAVSLAFPARDWPKAFRERRVPMIDPRPLRVTAGLGSILGKTVATTSKIPDPYNPHKSNWLERIREKYSFLAGGLIEVGAFSALTYDSFVNTKPIMKDGVLTNTEHSLKWRGKYHRDWLSTIGGAMFVTGYIVRSWAKFGERRVDMAELYAHCSDTIAKLPSEKIPQALADTAAYLADHFKGKPGLSFGTIYNKISDDLSLEHHITINPRSHHITVSRVEKTGTEVTRSHPSTQVETSSAQIAPTITAQQPSVSAGH